MRRWAWPAVAAAALLLLAGLALRSPDRQQSLAEYQAGGTMKHIAEAGVQRVRLQRGAMQREFQRGPDGRWQGADAATAEAIDMGLRLLHNAVPERDFDTAAPEFGLDPPALRVVVQASGAPPFEAEFGVINPMGLAHYVRIRRDGQATLHLLPSYVAETWAPALPAAAP